jgi:poly(beta-D-mannuronate) lyase
MLCSIGWLLLAAGCVASASDEVETGGADTGRDTGAPCVAAAETCNDVDDDCDGAVDEDGVCDDDPGDTADTGGDTADTGETGVTATVPGERLDLTNWKLTLPIAAEDDPSSPREISQPELADFSMDPWFHLDVGGDAVVFRADAGGVTTSNSGYPRSELREMTDDGASRASWSTASGTHTMTFTAAVTHLPEAKPHVVVGQIHDAEDDVVMVRLEGDHLFVEGGGDNLGDLDGAYVLGEPFTVRMVAEGGRIDVYYQDLTTPAVSVDRDVDGCYFKAGVYTQSNPDHGDAPDAYGEVSLSDLAVTHE